MVLGDEIREARLAIGTSQAHVAHASGMSRQRYGRIELGRCPGLTVLELNRVGSIVGLNASVRLYPAGLPVRDAAQSTRLKSFLALGMPPLTYRLEVGLPARDMAFEQRAWDACLYGDGKRTAIELEMRLRDIQALIRRIDLKRRDDPSEGFILLVAGTRHNMRLLTEFAGLFVDLPRLRTAAVRAALMSGRHPGTGITFV